MGWGRGCFIHGGEGACAEAAGLEVSVPFHLVITFESYSKIFKNKNKTKLQLSCGRRTVWGTGRSQPASLIQTDKQTDRQTAPRLKSPRAEKGASGAASDAPCPPHPASAQQAAPRPLTHTPAGSKHSTPQFFPE